MSLKDVDTNSHIIQLLQVSQHNTEGEDNHGKDREVKVVADGYSICPPHDEERVNPNPDRCTHKRQRVELLTSLAHWVGYRDVLHDLVREEDHVHYFGTHGVRHLQERLLLLVDIFQDQVVDEGLGKLDWLGVIFVLLPLHVNFL